MLEEADRATPDSVRDRYADVYREMRAAGYTAVGEFHYLGAAEAFAAADGGSCCRDRDRAAPCRLRARRSRSHAPAQRSGLPRGGRVAPRGGNRRRRRPPLRPRLLARLARGDRRLRTRTKSSHSTSMPTSSHARSRSASRSTAAARSSSSPTRAASPSGRPSSTQRMRTTTSSTCSLPPERASAPARRPSPTSATASCASQMSSTARSPSASARTRTCGSTRSRSSASSRGSHGARPGGAGSSTTAQLLEIGSAEGARALQLEEWAAIEIDPDHRSLAGVAPEHVEAALIAGCGADVVVVRGSVMRVDVTEETFETDVIARSAERPVHRRLLGRVVRPVPRPGARARGRGRSARQVRSRWSRSMSTPTRGSRSGSPSAAFRR